MISINISGANFEETLSELRGFAAPLILPRVEWQDVPKDDASTGEQAPASPDPVKQAAPAAEAPKRGRPKKTDTETVAALATPAADPAPVTAEAVIEEAKAEEPAPVAEAPETVAQDVADEKAETEAAKADEPAKTADDVRGVMGQYAKLYGMPAAQADLSKIWQTAGVTAAKVGDMTVADYTKAIDAVTAAIPANPFSRDKVA